MHSWELVLRLVNHKWQDSNAWLSDLDLKKKKTIFTCQNNVWYTASQTEKANKSDQEFQGG